MRAGPLRDRIRFESPGNGSDAMGAPKRVWVPILETRGSIQTVSGREYFSNGREEAADVVKIICRFHPKTVNITADCRAVDMLRGIVYAITTVLFDDKRTMMTVTALSGVSDG